MSSENMSITKKMSRLKELLLVTLFLTFCVDSVSAQLERKRAQPTDGPVDFTFMSIKNINLPTVEPLGKGVFHYSIMHTFGEVRSGYQQFWGIDNGANVKLSFEYGFTDRFSLELSRTSEDNNVEFAGRYHLLQQTRSGSMPVSVTGIVSAGAITEDLSFLPQEYEFLDRLNYSAAIATARKFNDQFSLQFSPMVAHFNGPSNFLSMNDPDQNTYFSLGVAGRYKVGSQTALSVQYISGFSGDNRSYNLALGIDIETGGHVFQIFVTTSQSLSYPYLGASENGNFFDRAFRIGFNVNRLFQLR